MISKRPPIEVPQPTPASVPELGRMLEGERLGQFVLEKFIGGGMGAVFRAHDSSLGRTVAVKVLSRERTDDETIRRFKVEAQSAARLNHENIARVYHVGEDRGWSYIVFEFIEGLNIRDLVEQHGALPIEDALRYTLQAAEALDHAYQRNVVHRDIKPSNLIVTPEGRAKLVDMGLARLDRVEASSDDITASGVTLGTFDYISPEQARDPRSADVRSDLYSLGCTLYFMLADRPPFPEGTVLQKLLSHNSEEPTDLRILRPELPEEVVAIVKRMLAKQPSDRYQTPADLIVEILRIADRLGYESVMAAKPLWPVAAPAPRPLWERHLAWAGPIVALGLTALAIDALAPSRGLSLPRDYETARTLVIRAPLEERGLVVPPGAPDALETPQAPAIDDRLLSPTAPASAVETTVPSAPSSRGAPSSRAAPAASEPSSPLAAAPSLAATAGAADVRDLPGPSQRAALSGAAASPAPSTVAPPPGAPPPGAAPQAEAPPVEPGTIVVGAAESSLPAGARSAASLREACDLAKADSSYHTIELRTGELVERPFTVAAERLTIRAGEGFYPTILFDPDATSADGAMISPEGPMIKVTGGDLRIEGVRLELNIPADMYSRWALFGLDRAKSLELVECSLTIRNPQSAVYYQPEQAAFFDIEPPMVSEMQKEHRPTSGAGRISLMSCFARGDASLLRAAAAIPLVFEWNEGVLATSQRMIEMGGSSHEPLYNEAVQIKLWRLTALARSGLCRIKTSRSEPHQIPLDLECSESIVLTRPEAPLIELDRSEGRARQQDDLKFRAWGAGNYYPEAELVLRVQPAREGDGPAVALDVKEWRRLWELDLPERQQVLWSRGESPLSLDKPLDEHLAEDYRLSDSPNNPAYDPRSEVFQAGCDIDLLPPLAAGRLAAGAASSSPTDP